MIDVMRRKGSGFVRIRLMDVRDSFRSVLTSVSEIHKDSSSVPSYPAHLMRYCNLHLYRQLSLESRISEILSSGLLSTFTRDLGGWMWLGMVFRVDGLRTEM